MAYTAIALHATMHFNSKATPTYANNSTSVHIIAMYIAAPK